MNSRMMWAILPITATFCLSANAQHKKMTYDYKVSYGYFKDQMHNLILNHGRVLIQDLNTSYQKACEKKGGLKYQEMDFSRFINCGFNVTRLIHGHGQHIVQGTVEPRDIGTVYAEGAKIQLLAPFKIGVQVLPRNPDMAIRTLDYRKNLRGQRETPFYRNLEVKYQPHTSTGVGSFGMFLPGAEVRANIGTIRARGEKKIFWFIKAKADVDVTMDLGNFGFHSSHVFASSVNQFQGFDANNKPRFSTKLYALPIKMLGVQHRGAKVIRVQVRGANFFTKIALFIAKIFKVKVNDMAKQILNEQIQKHLNLRVANFAAKLEDGSLWKEVYEKSTLPIGVQFTRNLGKDIGDALKDTAATQPMDLLDVYTEVCKYVAKSSQEPKNYNNYLTLCRRGLVDVKLSAFYRDPVYDKKGCYSYFIHPVGQKQYYGANGKLLPANKWWRNDCQHVSRLDLTVRDTYQSAIDCVQREMKKGTRADRIAVICKKQFDNLIPAHLN